MILSPKLILIGLWDPTIIKILLKIWIARLFLNPRVVGSNIRIWILRTMKKDVDDVDLLIEMVENQNEWRRRFHVDDNWN